MNHAKLRVVGCLVAHGLTANTSDAQERRPPPPSPAWRADPNQTPAPVSAKAESEPSAFPCGADAGKPPKAEACSTPRDGVLSGVYLGFDAGPAWLEQPAADRIGAGGGVGLHVRLGVELWDHVLFGIGIAGLLLQDHRPVSESVVDCTTVDNVVVSCDDQPHSEGSSIGATLFTTEVGVQHRFRPWSATSWTPGLVTGYQLPTSNLERSVNCDGCSSIRLDATAAGAYVAPFFRVTFGSLGIFAVIARWQLYISGDVAQVPTLGAEIGLP